MMSLLTNIFKIVIILILLTVVIIVLRAYPNIKREQNLIEIVKLKLARKKKQNKTNKPTNKQ